ncbi:winged helix-turn-helix domain-containing protein [Spartinivicinus poritis]|uniref:Winged helix-turn-helix domain-containing protein n=1 Tax=Spartinivicinus poritis TaxID=2994640 RepID=A0ABT5UDW4_9GAMM|nr:winged helix-turn-helix domain-containing protein [Spartinivicinus sp. A2-2]MDE1464556.1 winged helix-turn-helix domain-containing protein [Spartinivicinus sp. A2-2]
MSVVLQEPSSELAFTINDNVVYLINKKWLFFPQLNTIRLVGGAETKLKNKTSNVLLFLVRNQGATLTTEHFFQEVWCSSYVSENVLTQSISQLRRVFEDKERKIILTVPKVGYRLMASVSQQQSEVEDEEPYSNIESTRSTPLKSLSTTVWHRVFLLLTATCLIISCVFSYRKYEETNLLKKRLSISEYQQQWYQELIGDIQRHPQFNKEAISLALGKAKAKLELPGANLHTELRYESLKAIGILFKQKSDLAQAYAVVSQLMNEMDHNYGYASKNSLRAGLLLVEIMLLQGKRQQSYDKAKEILKQTTLHHAKDTELMGDAHYWMSNTNLFCSYPICRRSESMEQGRYHAEQSLSYHLKHAGDEYSEKVADSLWLLNWFEFDTAKKITRGNKVVSIYHDILGEFHKKTASALAELSRIKLFFSNKPQEATQNIQRALKIYRIIYPYDHLELARALFYMGEHEFYLSKPKQAMSYFLEAKQIYERLELIETDRYFETLLLLAKANFYQHKLSTAEILLTQLKTISNDKAFVPSHYIRKELELIELRLKYSQGKEVYNENELNTRLRLNQQHQDASKYSYSKVSIDQELYILLLKKNKSDLAINEFKKSLTGIYKRYKLPQHSRYLTTLDIDYISQRAAGICKQYNIDDCPKKP